MKRKKNILSKGNVEANSISKKKQLVFAIKKSANALWKAVPIVIGVVILVSLVDIFLPPAFLSSIFRGNFFIDPFIGSVIGSILAGNPVTSYILGGELLSNGVGLLAVTSFIVAWVTVGVVSFPAESMLLGKRFALIRNISAFVSSLLVAILVVLIMGGLF